MPFIPKFTFLILLSFSLSSITLAQQVSISFGGNLGEKGQSRTHVIDEDNFWTLTTYKSGQPVTAFDILLITQYDKCGLVRSIKLSNSDIFGVLNISNSFMEGNKLRFVLQTNAVRMHNHAEVGVLSIDTETLAHTYNFVIADNIIFPFGLVPDKADGGYILHTFLSYIDRPVRFSTFKLDSDFRITDFYQFPHLSSISGSIVSFDDGSLIITGGIFIKLDKDLKPIWTKQLPDNYRIRKSVFADGFFYMVATTNSPEREMILIKIDLNGNLIWQSDNTLLEEPKAYDTRLSVDSNGDPILAVYGFIGSDPYTSDLVTYRFSKEEGRSIKIPDYEALQNIGADFKMIDYDHNPYPHMFVTEENGLTHMIRLHEDYQCFGGNTKTTELSTSINLSAITNRASLTDQGILTGTYEFSSEPTTIEWSELCPPFPPNYDLLKDDTTACQDLSLVLDLNDIPYDIIWEDGSTSKTRNITADGIYSYELDHCSLEYSEEINITLEDCSCDIQMPTIFSPNGDNKNDDFKLITECKHLESLNINILDRWGNLIYTHSGTDYNWDGTLNGQKLSEEVYVYQIEYKVISNTQWQLLTGTIALVR